MTGNGLNDWPIARANRGAKASHGTRLVKPFFALRGIFPFPQIFRARNRRRQP